MGKWVFVYPGVKILFTSGVKFCTLCFSMAKKGVNPEASQVSELNARVEKLERLVEIISRGKYQWESTFDAITSPVMIVDLDYRIQRANIAFASHCGLDITEVPGKLCYQLFADREEPCMGCPMRKAVDDDDRRSSALGHRAKQREFEANAYPMVISGDGSDGAVMSYRDITEERRLQQEVIQQEKMAAIGILAGGVAHEINNPLGGILAFTQLLLKDAREKENGELMGDLKEIENAAVRCKKIVADLLDFSRVSKDRERCEVDVNMLLQSVLPFIRSEIKSLNVDLELRVEEHLPKVEAVPDRLQQVFLNLMTNACHAMPKGGKLSIETRSMDGASKVMVSVQDQGGGISDENKERIFDPFFTTKQPGKGTGLGLSISYRIVKEHGGNIEVESELGKGTKFTVVLPAVGKL